VVVAAVVRPQTRVVQSVLRVLSVQSQPVLLPVAALHSSSQGKPVLRVEQTRLQQELQSRIH
jgi:hypothetical protein